MGLAHMWVEKEGWAADLGLELILGWLGGALCNGLGVLIRLAQAHISAPVRQQHYHDAAAVAAGLGVDCCAHRLHHINPNLILLGLLLGPARVPVPRTSCGAFLDRLSTPQACLRVWLWQEESTGDAKVPLSCPTQLKRVRSEHNGKPARHNWINVVHSWPHG